MKVAILAGGKGTRLSELTKEVPKPMVKIGSKPILIHIINLYLKYNIKEFLILVGYKSDVIKKFFKNFKKNNEPFSHKINNKYCKITIIESGKNSMTGGRLKFLKKLLQKDEEFMFTYGDGISNVNIKKLLRFHKKCKKMITVTAVRPPARFGEIIIKKNLVHSFKEKPQVTQAWINGGFFVAKKNFLNLIKNKKTILEKKPLEKASKRKQLAVFKHHNFWKCMDTLRDKEVLQNIYKKNRFNF